VKRHGGSTGSTTGREAAKAAKGKAREKALRKANNVLTKNTSLAERKRIREERWEREDVRREAARRGRESAEAV
jgi:hypothetical protein